jgi:hypothetical protein
MWISWSESLWESFNRTFVWDLLLIFQLARWKSEHDQWIEKFDWLKNLLELSSKLVWFEATMRWLNVTYSYWERKRNMIFLLKITVSIIKQWAHWMWRTFLYWISLSSKFLRFILWFLCELIQSSAMKRSLHDRIQNEKTSWRWQLSFKTVNVFLHARNLTFFMRDMLVFALLIVKSIISIDSESRSNCLWDFFWNSSKTIVFHEWKML